MIAGTCALSYMIWSEMGVYVVHTKISASIPGQRTVVVFVLR